MKDPPPPANVKDVLGCIEKNEKDRQEETQDTSSEQERKGYREKLIFFLLWKIF